MVRKVLAHADTAYAAAVGGFDAELAPKHVYTGLEIGGTFPRCSRSGHELVYQSGDQIMAASYTVKGDTFVPDKPRVWIAKLGGTSWDLAPDGKRVAVVTPMESAEAPKHKHEVVLLLNFLRRTTAASTDGEVTLPWETAGLTRSSLVCR